MCTHTHTHLGEGLGDTRLDVVGGGAKGFAALSHETSCKVPESPVIINIWPQTQLFTYYTRHHCREEFMQLHTNKVME